MYTLVVVFCYFVPGFLNAKHYTVSCVEKPVMVFRYNGNSAASNCAEYMRYSFKLSNDSAYAYCKPSPQVEK